MWWALILAACGGGEPAKPPEQRPSDDNIYRTAAEPTTSPEAQPRVGPPAEPMKLVLVDGAFTIDAKLGEFQTRHTAKVEQASFTIGDVTTLAYPIGHVKLDTLSWTSDPPTWTAPMIDRYLRDGQGAPIQIVFDMVNVGALNTRLDKPGATAMGRVIGQLQVHDRQIDVDFAARFQRLDENNFQVDLNGPMDVPIHAFGRQPQLDALAGIAKGPIDPMVHVQGTLRLQRFEGEDLPTFVRTPITVQSMEEVRRRIAEQVDLYRTSMQRVTNSDSVSPQVEKAVDRELYDKMRKQSDAAKGIKRP